MARVSFENNKLNIRSNDNGSVSKLQRELQYERRKARPQPQKKRR